MPSPSLFGRRHSPIAPAVSNRARMLAQRARRPFSGAVALSSLPPCPIEPGRSPSTLAVSFRAPSLSGRSLRVNSSPNARLARSPSLFGHRRSPLAPAVSNRARTLAQRPHRPFSGAVALPSLPPCQFARPTPLPSLFRAPSLVRRSLHVQSSPNARHPFSGTVALLSLSPCPIEPERSPSALAVPFRVPSLSGHSRHVQSSLNAPPTPPPSFFGRRRSLVTPAVSIRA